MNQIVDTLSQTGNWSAALTNTKNTSENTQKRFEDILNGRKEQMSAEKSKEKDQAELHGTKEQTMYQQVPVMFPWMQMQESVEQNASGIAAEGQQSQENILSIQEADVHSTPSVVPAPKDNGKEAGIFANNYPSLLPENAKELDSNQQTAVENQTLEIGTENSTKYTGRLDGGVVKETLQNSLSGEAKESPSLSTENSGQSLPFAAGIENHMGYEQKVTGQQEIQSYQEVAEQPDMQDLKDSIAKQISEGKTEFQVQLKPANMGTLVVNASYENGKTIITIACVEPKTMHVMMQNAAELGSLVQSRLGSPTEVVVEAPHADYLEQQNEQQKSQQQGNGQHHESRKEEVHEEAELFIQQLRLGLV
jgi:ribosomal protein L7Ae-like RNA K-turn-binding protein